MVLLINACVRSQSRTKRLADELMKKLGGPVREVRLWEIDLPLVDEAFIQKRDELVKQGAFDSPVLALAKEFAAADTIVIAAPFYDLSFPALLKQYLEQVCVIGITFDYGPDGNAAGRCKASSLYYVTTAGGTFFPAEYGFGYVKALAQNFYGIPDVQLIKAVGFDIEGADEAKILREAIENIHAMDIKKQ